MNFADKLKALTTGKNRAEIARRAGVNPAVLNNYLYRGSEPLAPVALKLARALGVSMEWLCDDTQDMPPPPTESGAMMSTPELVRELGRRMAPIALLMQEKLQSALRTDWVKVTRQLLETDVEKELPKHLKTAVETLGSLNLFHSELRRFDPVASTENIGTVEAKEMTLDNTASLLDLITLDNNLSNTPGVKQASSLAYLWGPKEYRPPWFNEIIDDVRKEAVDSLNDALRAQAKRESKLLTGAAKSRPVSLAEIKLNESGKVEVSSILNPKLPEKPASKQPERARRKIIRD